MARWGEKHSDYHIGKSSPGFVSSMRRLLQVRNAVHYEHGYKTGKVAVSRLFRVGLPPIDSGDWNSRVFKKKTRAANVTDSAIMLLGDGSGSMHGTKFQTVARASALCNDAFGNTLRVPLSIAAFSSRGPTPVIGLMKDFDEKVSDDQMADRFYDFLDHMSGNNDADVLLWGYYRLLQRKEKRKILIVLSDGSPADGIGDPYYALKQVTERITSEKRVSLYGIGIMDNNVESFYPNHRVIWSINELEPALVDVMGKALL